MMPPKTVIIGATGFIGRVFWEAHREIYPDCVGTGRDAGKKGTSFLDLSSPTIASLKLAESGHREALILAGMTKLAVCEQQKQLTRKINVMGVSDLVRQLVREGIKPIFFSSDIIFDGAAGRYDEGSLPNPLNEYGRQKVEVESRIKEICRDGNYLIIRLSKTFSLQKGDGTLLDEMASVLRSGRIVRAAHDQYFSPLYVLDLVQIVTILQAKNVIGVVNINSPEVWSRYDLALAMARCMEADVSRIEKISLDDLAETFRRPKNTTMKTSKIVQETGYRFTPTRQCIEKVAENWSNKDRKAEEVRL